MLSQSMEPTRVSAPNEIKASALEVVELADCGRAWMHDRKTQDQRARVGLVGRVSDNPWRLSYLPNLLRVVHVSKEESCEKSKSSIIGREQRIYLNYV